MVVAPADLQRIDADRLGGPVEQLLGDRAGNRLADGAVHARWRLVLEHRAQPAGIILMGVGTGGHHDRHHALGDRRAAVGGIGADRGQRIDVDALEPPLGIDADPGGDGLVARVDVADEGFQAVGDVFDRLADQHRDRRDRDLVAIDMELDPEPAADIGRDHPDRVLGQAQMQGKNVLLQPGRLMGAVDRQAPLAGIEVGDDGARLERHAGLP